MKAVVYKENGKIEMEERPRPKIREETDAVIKVTLTTICSSDLHIKHGAVPRAVPGTILGHEFVGIVEEVGSAVCKVKPGDRVAVNVETFCGEIIRIGVFGIQMNILASDTTNMILQMVQDLLQKNMIGTLSIASGYQIIQNHITCI